MTCDVIQISDADRKADIADGILRSLPGWFGIDESIVEYVRESRGMPFWAAIVESRSLGFLSLKRHNPFASEIYCMGILEDFHRQGIGKQLVHAAEMWCARAAADFLTVKTLDASSPSEEYARTRAFYLAAGFKPLEVFPNLWGPENPCLFMAKGVRRPTG